MRGSSIPTYSPSATRHPYTADAFIRKVSGSSVLRLEDLRLLSAYTRMDADLQVTSVYAGETMEDESMIDDRWGRWR